MPLPATTADPVVYTALANHRLPRETLGLLVADEGVDHFTALIMGDLNTPHGVTQTMCNDLHDVDRTDVPGTAHAAAIPAPNVLPPTMSKKALFHAMRGTERDCKLAEERHRETAAGTNTSTELVEAMRDLATGAAGTRTAVATGGPAVRSLDDGRRSEMLLHARRNGVDVPSASELCPSPLTLARVEAVLGTKYPRGDLRQRLRYPGPAALPLADVAIGRTEDHKCLTAAKTPDEYHAALSTRATHRDRATRPGAPTGPHASRPAWDPVRRHEAALDRGRGP